MSKRMMRKAVFLLPFIVLLIGIVAYITYNYLILSNCDATVSLGDIFITDLQSIIITLQDPEATIFQFDNISGIQLFWWIWLASFISSLFFSARQLHRKPEPDAPDAILFKRKPYVMIQNVSFSLKRAQQGTERKELANLVSAVKRLEEKLFVESDFGYGNKIVIECENTIAMKLQLLEDYTSHIDVGDIVKNAKSMEAIVLDIDCLLKQRIELKRR